MFKGSCLCGAVKFEVTEKPSLMGTCHCSRCRKSGASTMVFVKKEHLVWHEGREKVALYQPQAPHKYGRCFCRSCGTSLGEILSKEDKFPISANAFDTELDLKIEFHEHLADKPSWVEISDTNDKA